MCIRDSHTSVIYAHRSVRDDEFLIDAYYAAETFAGRAGSERGVEGKHVVGRLFNLHAVSFEPGRDCLLYTSPVTTAVLGAHLFESEIIESLAQFRTCLLYTSTWSRNHGYWPH